MTKELDAFVRDLLTTHPGDPANAPCLVPLDSEQEEMAQIMADFMYSACTDHFDENTTQEQADRVYEQCLIDARRMVCDENYMRIFRE